MERVGDVLRRLDIAQGSTGASSAGSKPAAGPRPPEEAVCPHCGGSGWVGLDLPVDDPRFGQAVPCVCREEESRRVRVDRLQRYSNLGPLSGITLAGTVERGVRPDAPSQELFARAIQAARAFAQEPHGWLVLAGPPGTGKTHLAAAIANERIRQGQPAFFIFVPDFLDHLRAAYAPDAGMTYDELFQRVREAPFLVLDDLGAQAATPWAQEKLFQVLNHRFVARLPTVITLGTTLGQLEPRIEARLADPEVSRICSLAVEVGRWRRPSALELPRFREMTFQTFQTRRPELTVEQRESVEGAFRAARAYAERPDGWLVLLGEHGVGKTHLAAATAHACQERGMEVLFLIVPDLLDHLRYTFRPDSGVSYDQLFEEVKRVPLLVLDDLGAHATSPWAQEKLYQIINYRYNAHLPLVVTTDLSLDELERVEARIASRLADTRFSVPFVIGAPDFRVDRPSTPGSTGRGPTPRPPRGSSAMDRRRMSG